MTVSNLKKLLEGHHHKTLTLQQQQELFELISDPENEAAIKQLIDELADWNNKEPVERLAEQDSFAILQTILSTGNQTGKVVKASPFRQTPVRWAAAAIITLALGTGIYLWVKESGMHGSVAKTIAAANIAPGKTGAVLILADGSSITLDTLRDGYISRQGSTGILLQQGQLTYDGGTRAEGISSAGNQAINTLRTPKGRQFKLVLPDGSRIWLNAASSITFPSVFTGKERVVDITGEAFFEVHENAAKPFIVNIGNGTRVQVLGTSFNVNAYSDEPQIKTTLLDGRVQVMNGEAAITLKPGEQVLQAAGQATTLRTLKNVDLEEVAAWKNGLFSLKSMDIKALMRQLSRWYDIEVEVREDTRFSALRFGGSVSRDVQLPDLLTALKVYGIDSRMEHGKLVMFPQESAK